MKFLPLLLLLGCDNKPKACTLIGCVNGITVTIMDSYGSPAINASGVITVDDTEYGFDCSNPDESEIYCENGIFFIPTESESDVYYDVQWADESAVGSMELEFVESMPNGEGCEPICLHADITIELFRPIE